MEQFQFALLWGDPEPTVPVLSPPQANNYAPCVAMPALRGDQEEGSAEGDEEAGSTEGDDKGGIAERDDKAGSAEGNEETGSVEGDKETGSACLTRGR